MASPAGSAELERITTIRTRANPLEAHTALLDWVISHNGFLADSVCIAHDASRGVHMQVKTDRSSRISKDTRVVNTPLNLTISYFNAIGYNSEKGSFSKHELELPREFIDAVGREETTAFFLMGQFLRGENSFWYPYLRTLPQPGQMTTPLFFGEEDVDWIQGTGIPDASVQRFQTWDQKFDYCMERLQESGFEGVEEYTWDLYLWAWTIITSRAFSAKVLSSAIEPADLPEEGVSVLLPLIDLPNHRPLAKVEWRAGEKDVGMIMLEDIAPGEEISNNYGPRNNEQLLMNYGFCIQNNPTDYRIVKLGVKPNSPLGQAKARQTQMFPGLANNKDDHYYIFNVFYPLLAPEGSMEHAIISPALFDALTIMEGNDRERKDVDISEAGICIPQKYGNGRCRLAALAQISFELIAHIAMLRDSGEDLPDQPTNLKQTFAKIYRDGQSTLDKTALIITSWTLARAREHNRQESWEDIKVMLNEHLSKVPADYFPEEILSKVRVRILERRSLVPRNGELFRLMELFTLLPAELQGSCQKYWMEYIASGPWATDPQVMFSLAIGLLAATARATQTKPLVSSRLTRWFDFLITEYPLGGSEDAPESQGRQFLQALSTNKEQFLQGASECGLQWLTESGEWMNAEWLQWACTVGDAERVLVPLEPLQVLVEDPTMAKQAVLYVPQE